MKFVPILFQTEMVKAILDNRKDMTRRVIKGLRDGFGHPQMLGWQQQPQTARFLNLKIANPYDEWQDIKCPYGQVGDILWVKEEHYSYGCWVQKGVAVAGKQKWMFVPQSTNVFYDPEESATKYKSLKEFLAKEHGHPGMPTWYKRNSLFMPKSACRIFLEITCVKVERLQDISPDDAGHEGVEYDNVDAESFNGGELVADYKNYMWRDDEKYEDYYFPHFADSINSFRTLWQSINGVESWDENPWVWAIKFKKVSKPENFV